MVAEAPEVDTAVEVAEADMTVDTVEAGNHTVRWHRLNAYRAFSTDCILNRGSRRQWVSIAVRG